MVDRNIIKEVWYHGLLPREDIKLMLRKNGDFLVRSTEPVKGEPRQYVLSVMDNEDNEDQGIKHFVLRETGGKIIVETQGHDTIAKLLSHHLTTKEPINKTTVLRSAIARKEWELSHNDVTLEKKLGEGAFGEVWQGKLTLKSGRIENVAIKTAKLESLNKEQIKEVMREARLMRCLDHPNIVKFYGVAADSEPLYVIMELADEGALNSFLQKNTLAIMKKWDVIYQAASGIAYMHEKQFLHRDIAARNCLYKNGQVKIADFGLSREGTAYQMDLKKKVPVRWLAPETLKNGLCTQKSDVYAFGMLAWEIFENGKEPYAGMTTAEVMSQVGEGYRLAFTDEIDPEMRKMFLKKCWSENPQDRYTMRQLCRHIQRTYNFKSIQPYHSHERLPEASISEDQSQSKRKKIALKKRASIKEDSD